MSEPRVRIEPNAVPAEIDRWNWGAFLLNWIWGIGNNTFIALLTLIPFVGLIMPFVLGAKGSGWAWRNGRWDSLEHFKRVQRLWAIWGAVMWIVAIVLGGALVGGVFYVLGQSEAYQLGISKLKTNSEAADVLGTPISTGIPSGSITINGESGRAVLNFSATGPKAAGRVFVEAFKRGGVWSLRSFTLKVDGRDGVIDLLKQSSVELESFRWRFGEHRESELMAGGAERYRNADACRRRSRLDAKDAAGCGNSCFSTATGRCATTSRKLSMSSPRMTWCWPAVTFMWAKPGWCSKKRSGGAWSAYA